MIKLNLLKGKDKYEATAASNETEPYVYVKHGTKFLKE